MSAFAYLSYFVIGILFLLGVFCLFSESASQWFTGNGRYAMGIVFIAYGAFRLVRVRHQIKSSKH